ncbi:MAG TPA: porin family protein [Saprospiraceae bacterium]|nr:porin family protein [Saprospiraceae bacterium]
MKTLTLMIVLLCSPIFLSAQLGVGIKAGANFANISTDDYETSSRTSYHAGAYANFKLSDKWGITPEVLWSSQGGDLDDVEFETNYVTVPIMLRWRIIDLISVEAGPQFNVLTSAKSDGVDVLDDLTSPSYSAAFGALVHLPLGFNAGLRYVVGLSDISESENDSLKDNTFQIYVGWTILGAK